MHDFLQRAGSVRKCIHGNGRRTVERVLTTAREMLSDRGYTHAEEGDETAPSPSDWVLAGRRGDDGAAVYVYLYRDEARVGIKYARTVYDYCTEHDATAVVISLDGPTPFAKRRFEDGMLQFFTINDLCVNITRHVLVPVHERVEDLPPHVTTKQDLPLMLTTDKVCQYYNWPVGAIIRIWRQFGGQEPIPYYRVVALAEENA